MNNKRPLSELESDAQNIKIPNTLETSYPFLVDSGMGMIPHEMLMNSMLFNVPLNPLLVAPFLMNFNKNIGIMPIQDNAPPNPNFILPTTMEQLALQNQYILNRLNQSNINVINQTYTQPNINLNLMNNQSEKEEINQTFPSQNFEQIIPRDNKSKGKKILRPLYRRQKMKSSKSTEVYILYILIFINHIN